MMTTTACVGCGERFNATQTDKDFYERVSPEFAGKLFEIASPRYCPECRLQRRLASRNERKLYRRPCDATGELIISTIGPHSSLKVYSNDYWWSDDWDPMSYGMDYDPSKPFFDQLRELIARVPHLPLTRKETENSDYTNYAHQMKNCYLVFGASLCEDVLYAKTITRSKSVLDGLSLVSCELCYEGISSEGCYNCKYFKDCQHCRDSFMIEACQSCNNCALCFGLHRKEYCILNEYVGKERYEQFINELRSLTQSKLEELERSYERLKDTLPHRASYIWGSENCSGNMIMNCKNCHYSFDIMECEDCKYLYWVPKGKDSYDCSFCSPSGVELCYEVCSTLASRSIGCYLCWEDDRAFYCLESHNSRNIFGCVGLRRKEYCILNKQYSREQYESLAAQIASSLIKEDTWGEYLPPQCSLFAYNETIAQEHFPMTRESAAKHNWEWLEIQESESGEIATNLPPSIDDVDDSILQKVLICGVTGRKYRITPQELAFYRIMDIPIPRLHPDVRHAKRLERKSPLRLWERQCAMTGEYIFTTHPPSATYSVYSNEAYIKQFIAE